MFCRRVIWQGQSSRIEDADFSTKSFKQSSGLHTEKAAERADAKRPIQDQNSRRVLFSAHAQGDEIGDYEGICCDVGQVVQIT